MATRWYLSSTNLGVAVTPADYEFGAQINPLTLVMDTVKDGSAMTTKVEATGTVNPTARAMLRFVSKRPVAAQTISGALKAQMRGAENNAGANATLAIAVKIIKPDGTDRAILLAQTASDAATAGNELVLTTLTNAQFKDAAESASITLTDGDATAGDYLCIEIGFRSATATTRNISLSYGSSSATDLAEDTTTTTANNPWVEFDDTITFVAAAGPTATAPDMWLKADSGAFNATGTTLATDGQTVQSWNDASGNGNNPYMTTSGSRPTFQTSEINSLPVIRFDGADDYLFTEFKGDPKTVILIGKISDPAGDQHWGCGNTSDAINLAAWYFKACIDAATPTFYRTTVVETDASTDFFATKEDIVLQASDGFLIWMVTQDGTTVKLYSGMDVLDTDTTVNAVRPVSSTLIGAASYGGAGSAPLSCLNGDIAEYLQWSSVLSDAELRQVVDYLIGRYYPNRMTVLGSSYYLGCFDGTGIYPTGMVLKGSDGQAFATRAGMAHVPIFGNCRDSTLIYAGGFYKAFTDGYPGGVFDDCNGYSIAKCTDGATWQHIARIDLSSIVGGGTNRRVWSPVWFKNNDGRLYIIVTTNSDDWTAASEAYIIEHTGTNFATAGTPVEITGTGFPGWQIAGGIIRRTNNTYMFCTKKEQPGAELKFFSSSSLASGYTLLFDAGSGGGNWGEIEGGLLLRLPNGNIRVYYDRFFAGTGLAYRDSTTEGVSWGSEVAVTGDGTFTVRNGGAITPIEFIARRPQIVYNQAVNRASRY